MLGATKWTRRASAVKPSTESEFRKPPDTQAMSHFKPSPVCSKGPEAQQGAGHLVVSTQLTETTVGMNSSRSSGGILLGLALSLLLFDWDKAAVPHPQHRGARCSCGLRFEPARSGWARSGLVDILAHHGAVAWSRLDLRPLGVVSRLRDPSLPICAIPEPATKEGTPTRVVLDAPHRNGELDSLPEQLR